MKSAPQARTQSGETAPKKKKNNPRDPKGRAGCPAQSAVSSRFAWKSTTLRASLSRQPPGGPLKGLLPCGTS
jgi:hypothetical protein